MLLINVAQSTLTFGQLSSAQIVNFALTQLNQSNICSNSNVYATITTPC